MTMINICCAKATKKSILATNCPDCEKRTRLLQFYTPWYGWHSTCLKCGRQWEDGEWMPLPFESGKPRLRNIQQAKKRWRNMPPVPENHFGLEDK